MQLRQSLVLAQEGNGPDSPKKSRDKKSRTRSRFLSPLNDDSLPPRVAMQPVRRRDSRLVMWRDRTATLTTVVSGGPSADGVGAPGACNSMR